MATAITQLSFPAAYYHASCMRQMQRIISRDRMSEELLNKVEIDTLEALTNIVRCAYRNIPNGVIQVTCHTELEVITIIFRDRGAPLPDRLFKTAEGTVFDFDAENFGSVSEGGMGVSLIRALFERAE